MKSTTKFTDKHKAIGFKIIKLIFFFFSFVDRNVQFVVYRPFSGVEFRLIKSVQWFRKKKKSHRDFII